MNKTEVKHPEKTVSTGSYSPGVLCDGWLFISGHAAQDLGTGEIIGDTIEEQTRLTLTHVGSVLAQAGCSFDHVVKCSCFLTDMDDFNAFDKTYRQFFSGVMPARTTVQSVLSAGIRIEIDAIARVPRGDCQ